MSATGEVRVRLSIDGKLLGHRGQADRIRKMLSDGKLKKLRVTFVPQIAGGAETPTLTGRPSESLLGSSLRLRLERMVTKENVCEAIYAVPAAANFLPPSRRKR